MTPAQIKNIHVAAGKVGFAKEQYRMMLLNVAGVTTSKDLTNAGYEDCMALLEDHGYRQILDGQLCPPDYWRRKVARRGTFANGRLIHKIEALYLEFQKAIGEKPDLGSKMYPLPALIHRASDSRTDKLTDLTPREANNLIEMLKAIIARSGADALVGRSPVPTTENTEATEADDMPF